MTAKQALRNYIEELSDDEALALLHRLESEDQLEPEPFTEAELAAIARGREQIAAGQFFTTQQVRDRFGLDD